MELDFSKFHGTGNDFVMVEDLADEITLTREQVIFLCDRHFGIGADGVILVKPSPRPECVAYMHYINSDGSLAQMCGNGVRCFAKFLVDRGIVDPAAGSFIADTLAGTRPITFEVDSHDKLVSATVDMGEPILSSIKVPTAIAPTKNDVVIDATVETPYGNFSLTCVSMGNPHAITFIDNPLSLEIEKPGRYLETCDLFPEKSNIEFACVDRTEAGETITMRVWERGCGETFACGTGACATAVAGVLTGQSGRAVDLKLLGGTLHIEWREDTNHVIMTGPAKQVFAGHIAL